MAVRRGDGGGGGGGGRLSRSETVTVRLDPKLNYLCDLAARVNRRTKSSMIEAALAATLHQVPIDPRPTEPPGPTIAQLAEQLWHIDDVERLRRLAHIAPHLMSYEEQKIWAVIGSEAFFWFGQWTDLDQTTQYYVYGAEPSRLWIDRVREHWPLIQRVASGEADAAALPHMDRVRPTPPRALVPGQLPMKRGG
jgi:hypothetical protein